MLTTKASSAPDKYIGKSSTAALPCLLSFELPLYTVPFEAIEDKIGLKILFLAY